MARGLLKLWTMKSNLGGREIDRRRLVMRENKGDHEWEKG